MQIKKLFKESYTYRIIIFLFADDFDFRFTRSLVGKIFNKIKIPYFSYFLTFLSITLFWYEGIVSRIVPNISLGIIPSIILILAFLFADKNKIVIKKYHIWYLSLLSLAAISAVFAVFWGIDAKLLIFGWALLGQFFVALLLGQTLSKEQTIKFLIFGGLPLALTGIWQFVSEVKTPSAWFASFETGSTRAFAFMGSPNVLGVLVAILALISFAFYLKNKNRWYVFFSIIYSVTMLFTFSREAWVGYLVGLFIIIYHWKKKLFYFSPLISVVFLFNQVRERVLVTFSQTYWFDSYLDGRIRSLINGLFLASKRLFLGWGPGSYGGQLATQYNSPVYSQGIQNGNTPIYYADNQFIEILVQGGFLGIISLIGFIISASASLLEKRNNMMAIGVLGAFACFWVSGIFANVLEFGAISIPIGLLLGLAVNE